MKLHDTLVLNKSWTPIHVIDYRKTMNLLYQGQANALDREYLAYTWDDWIEFTMRNADDYAKIHTSRMAIAVPEIMVLIKYNRLPTREIKFSRENIFQRDKYTCLYCGQIFPMKNLTLDHIIPKSRGGKTTWDNIASACKPCNNHKDNKMLQESGMRLLKHPTKPTWLNPITGARGKAQICPSWEKFMNRVSLDTEDECVTFT